MREASFRCSRLVSYSMCIYYGNSLSQPLLQVAVQRGQEMSRHGVLQYEVTLKVVGRKYASPIVYTTQQRFSK